MDTCEAYARLWAKKEDVELDTLSEWIKSIGDVLKRRIRRLKHSVNTRHESIFSDPNVVTELSRLHENFVIVPADKASNNYTFVCKRYYVKILIEELGLHLLPGNPTYNLTDFSASEVLDNHKSVLTSFGIGCSSVIEYSRNLIWPRSNFFILSVWCWFSYGMLINSNNVWIWGIIQICRTFARIWQISFLL